MQSGQEGTTAANCPQLEQVVSDFLAMRGQKLSDAEAAHHQMALMSHRLGLAIREAETAGLDRDAIKRVLGPAIELHGESPFIRRLQTWPRGYPGDFETIEYICECANRAEPETPAWFVEHYVLTSAITQQHRNKVAWQASRILSTSLSGVGEKRVLSIGCGGSRDLRSIQSLLKGADLQIYLNDMDADALALSRSSLADIRDRVTTISADVFRGTREFVRCGPFDLVLAGGLFDYLDDRQLKWLLPKLHSCLKPGGALCFTNLARGNPTRVWMEYVCNWVIIERSEEEVRALLAASGLQDRDVSISRDGTGLALLVELRNLRRVEAVPREPAGACEMPGGPMTTASTAPLSGEFTAMAARSHAEREDIYRMRYHALVEVQRQKQAHADAGLQLVTDPLDEFAVHHFVADDGKTVAALRYNVVAGCQLDACLTGGLALAPFLEEFGGESLAYTSQLTIHPGWRETSAPGVLFEQHFAALRSAGIQFDFLHCPPALIGFFEQIGYRRYTANFEIPDAGLQVPMVLVVEDVDHLRRVRSPLAALGPSDVNRTDAPEWFARNFPEQSRFLNRRMLERDAFWQALSAILHVSPGAQVPLFKGISDDEVQRFIRNAIVHRAAAGETIVRPGEAGDEMFVILSGTAEVIGTTDAREVSLRILRTGDVFGELGLFLGTGRTALVRTIAETEFLVLTKAGLEQNLKTAPETTGRVLINLIRAVAARLDDNTRILTHAHGRPRMA